MPKSVRFYPADFFATVQAYPVTVAGAYILALCKYWEAGSVGLPDDQEDLQKLCRCSGPEWRKLGLVVFGKLFVKDAGGLWREKAAGRAASAVSSRVG